MTLLASKVMVVRIGGSKGSSPVEEAKEMEKMERSISKKIDDAAESGPIAILKNVAEGIDEIREGILSSENRPGGMLDITVHAYTEEFGHFKLQMTTV